MRNLLKDLPDCDSEEITEPLIEGGDVRIERIVSTGQCSPEGFWYDQPENEFVLIVGGAAKIRFADQTEPLELQAGDWLDIPAHKKHRVDWTSTDEPTIWLVVFY